MCVCGLVVLYIISLVDSQNFMYLQNHYYQIQRKENAVRVLSFCLFVCFVCCPKFSLTIQQVKDAPVHCSQERQSLNRVRNVYNI